MDAFHLLPVINQGGWMERAVFQETQRRFQYRVLMRGVARTS